MVDFINQIKKQLIKKIEFENDQLNGFLLIYKNSIIRAEKKSIVWVKLKEDEFTLNSKDNKISF
jgi:hypothetical protein